MADSGTKQIFLWSEKWEYQPNKGEISFIENYHAGRTAYDSRSG